MPRRYAQQFAAAEDALRKMEEAIRTTREMLAAAKELANEVQSVRPTIADATDPPDAKQ